LNSLNDSTDVPQEKINDDSESKLDYVKITDFDTISRNIRRIIAESDETILPQSDQFSKFPKWLVDQEIEKLIDQGSIMKTEEGEFIKFI